MVTWPSMPLGEICDLINGRAFKPSDWGTSGLPIVRIQNLNNLGKPFNMFGGDYTDKHFIDNGEILISWSGTPGTSFGCFRWLRGPALLNQHIFKVIVNENVIDGDFFINAVNSKLDEMIRHAHGGVGLRHITKKKLEAILLPVPSLLEQRRIVARIKECMGRVEEIENIRKEATHELESLIPAALEDIFHKNGFDEAPLFDLLREKPKNGVYLPKGDYVESGGVPIVRMGEMFRRFEVKQQVERSVNATKKLVDNYGLLEGDVLVARRSIVYEGSGSMAMVTKSHEGSIFESSIIRLRLDVNRILPRFVVAFFHSREGFYRRMSITKKATISGVNQQGLKRLMVPCPSIQNQKDALQRIDHVRASCSEMQSLIPGTEVSALRESILCKAFAGEL